MAHKAGLKDIFGVDWTIGWIAFSAAPWRVIGPFADIEEAAHAREDLGRHSRIIYAEMNGAGDFVPCEEPSSA